MISELEFVLKNCDNPKVKAVLLKIAALPEHEQKPVLDMLKVMGTL